VRELAFRVGLRVPVAGIRERTGWLLEGDAGWGEWSPLPSWSEAERNAGRRAAEEAARLPFPRPLRKQVEVSMLVPRVSPAEAVRLATTSGCRTFKIKVGDPDSEARVEAVRSALPEARIRLDAQGAWDEETALIRLAELARFQLDYVEDPVADMDGLARLRRRSPVPIAAESCVRDLDDVKRLRRLDAADALVIKPQRLGGIRASLEAAEVAGIPVVPSSALETSVGLAAVLAVAAALPELPYAAGLGTASLLERDVVLDPLLPEDGMLTPRRPTLDVERVGHEGASS
jgi:O-succinylbenzoate synthase